MIAAYAYTRVSGRGQLEGSGLERQEEGIDNRSFSAVPTPI